jgi:hypothetical protein
MGVNPEIDEHYIGGCFITSCEPNKFCNFMACFDLQLVYEAMNLLTE